MTQHPAGTSPSPSVSRCQLSGDRTNPAREVGQALQTPYSCHTYAIPDFRNVQDSGGIEKSPKTSTSIVRMVWGVDNSPTRFVVFTTQRSGSTWLMSILNGLEGVSAQGELFLPRPRSPEKRWDSDFALPRYVESKKTHGSVRPFSVYSYLSALYSGDGWIGFKLMYSQLRRYPEILPYLVRKRVRVVHLVRRNHLDVLISFAVKREIGKAHILSPEDRPADVKVELDTASLHHELRKLERRHTMGRTVLRLARLNHLEVAYEDLVADPARLDSVRGFLGISAQGIPQSNILKTRTEGQEHVVANYDDVRAALADSRFSALLDGGSSR